MRAMFSRIAGRYDLLNSLLSLGRDRSWRREAAQVALAGDARELLDAATGTGELALELGRQRPEARVIGLDFSEPMLDHARRKAARQGARVEWLHGDATQLPFEDASFDTVTIAYGLRNLPDPQSGLRELARVVRPGGRLVVLEFPPPQHGLVGRLFRFYFVNILPRVGGVVSGSSEAYSYLPASVLSFPGPDRIAALMQEAGLRQVRYRLQTAGISAIFVGEKRP